MTWNKRRNRTPISRILVWERRDAVAMGKVSIYKNFTFKSCIHRLRWSLVWFEKQICIANMLHISTAGSKYQALAWKIPGTFPFQVSSLWGICSTVYVTRTIKLEGSEFLDGIAQHNERAGIESSDRDLNRALIINNENQTSMLHVYLSCLNS